MPVLIAVWFALVGGLAALAGLAGMRRVRRLRRHGLTTWAVAVPAPAVRGSRPDALLSPGPPSAVRSRQVLIQYPLADGRVIERMAPSSARKSVSLQPGQKVLVWYDPNDPDDILVYGRWGRAADRAFVTAGVLLVLIGVAVATFGH
jgi:hypothetical protein